MAKSGGRKVVKPVAAAAVTLGTIASIWWFALKPRRKAKAIAIAVETFDALASERGESGKIWASVLKSAIKRRKPDFTESYYGFKAFGNLLEEAQLRGLLEVGRDESRRRAEDFLLWAQILLSGYRCAKINQVLASWHKAPYGAGGLSGDLAAMYRAAVDTRKTLYAQGLIGQPQMYVAHAISLVRYARRRLLTFARHRPGAFGAKSRH